MVFVLGPHSSGSSPSTPAVTAPASSASTTPPSSTATSTPAATGSTSSTTAGQVSDRSRFEAALGFALDDFQRRALDALDAGRSVLVAAPTGSGKTVVAE